MGGRTRGVWTEGSGLEYGCGTVARTGADGAQAIRAARDPGPGPSHHAEKNINNDLRHICFFTLCIIC